jgi:hypothetical protein
MANYSIQGCVTVSLRSYPRFRFRKGKVNGRVPYESVSGFEWSVRTGQWVRKTRVIDREQDRYFELVIDEVSGAQLHRCEEPLSDHRGHGHTKRAIGAEAATCVPIGSHTDV